MKIKMINVNARPYAAPESLLMEQAKAAVKNGTAKPYPVSWYQDDCSRRIFGLSREDFHAD